VGKPDAALITASCAGVIGYARAASMEMALAASFPLEARVVGLARREANLLAVFYLSMALGMLAKGPVASVLAAGDHVVRPGLPRSRMVLKTLWLRDSAVLCDCSAVVSRGADAESAISFREFILQHNLARFSRRSYHHPSRFVLPSRYGARACPLDRVCDCGAR